MTDKPSPSCLDHACQLIGFNTISDRPNLDLIEYVATCLAQCGVESVILPGDEAGKANLFATIGPDDRPGVILSGHTDTVPAGPDEWHSDPFVATIRNQRLYGRGSTDMKGFLAAVLAAIPRFQAADLCYPIHIAFSHDEEVGCLGVHGLIEHIQDRRPLPLACLVGEPTGMTPVWGHKGKQAICVTITGRAGHSSAATGMNSIEAAAAVISLIGEMRDEYSHPDDQRFDPPCTTMQVGVITGGEALNICPARCQFSFELRTLPGQDGRQIVAAIEKRAAALVSKQGFGLTFTPLASMPALAVDDNHQAWQRLYSLADCSGVEGSMEGGYVSFGTEAGFFQEAAIPSLVIGPGRIDQAHQPDEYIALDQLAACERFLERLCQRLSDEAWGREGAGDG